MSDQAPDLLDVAIIGGGAAGLTCAIYAGRARWDAVVLEKMMPGGQIALNDTIENYPGFPDGIGGLELAQAMGRQAERFGARMETAEVSAIHTGRSFRVETSGGDYHARSVLVATGCSPRHLEVPGERELAGRGVSYCGTCDGPLFQGKPVMVVGGGNTAIDDALFLAKIASEVTVVHRRDQLRADLILQERAFEQPNIDFLWSHVLTAVVGEDSVRAARVRKVTSDEQREVPVDAVFIAIGEIPQTNFVSPEVSRDESGYILTDHDLQTAVPGIFAAGDVRAGAYRQIAAAVGEGVLAYRSIRNYLESHQ